MIKAIQLSILLSIYLSYYLSICIYILHLNKIYYIFVVVNCFNGNNIVFHLLLNMQLLITCKNLKLRFLRAILYLKCVLCINLNYLLLKLKNFSLSKLLTNETVILQKRVNKQRFIKLFISRKNLSVFAEVLNF